MPRRRNSVPTYRLHKKSGQAVADYWCPIAGIKRCLYLGKFGSPESWAEHARLCSEMAAGQGRIRVDSLTVNELLFHFLKHAEQYYRLADGTPTSEVYGFKMTMKAVRPAYGHTLASEFGIASLKTVRSGMIRKGWSRKTVNQCVWRIKKIFKWGVEEGLVSHQIYQALLVVGGLQAGRSEARENVPVKPVPDEIIEKTLPHLAPYMVNVIRLQQATGMRSGEAISIRMIDIDTSENPWRYTPRRNKTAHKGRNRVVLLGPIAQQILNQVRPADPEQHVFASHRKPGEHYGVGALALAVRRACDAAKLPRWHPHQIRHTFASKVRKAYGLDGSQVVLGHAKAQISELYAEKDLSLAAQIAKDIG